MAIPDDEVKVTDGNVAQQQQHTDSNSSSVPRDGMSTEFIVVIAGIGALILVNSRFGLIPTTTF